MKKAIVISLIVLLLNFLFAQSLRPASEKDFNAAYDAQIQKTLRSFQIFRPSRSS